MATISKTIFNGSAYPNYPDPTPPAVTVVNFDIGFTSVFSVKLTCKYVGLGPSTETVWFPETAGAVFSSLDNLLWSSGYELQPSSPDPQNPVPYQLSSDPGASAYSVSTSNAQYGRYVRLLVDPTVSVQPYLTPYDPTFNAKVDITYFKDTGLLAQN